MSAPLIKGVMVSKRLRCDSLLIVRAATLTLDCGRRQATPMVLLQRDAQPAATVIASECEDLVSVFSLGLASKPKELL